MALICLGVLTIWWQNIKNTFRNKKRKEGRKEERKKERKKERENVVYTYSGKVCSLKKRNSVTCCNMNRLQGH